MIIVCFLAASFAATILYVATTALVGRAFGLRPKALSFGTGPALPVVLWRGVDIRLGLVIFAGSVRFGDAPSASTIPSPEGSGTAMEGLPLWRQLALALAGVTALLLAACLLAGPDILQLAWQGALMLVQLAVSPLQHENLLADTLSGFAALPPAGRIAAVFAVYAGINLVPLAFHRAGAAIMAVLGRHTGLAYDHGFGRAYLLASLALYGWIVINLALQAWRMVGQSSVL